MRKPNAYILFLTAVGVLHALPAHSSSALIQMAKKTQQSAARAKVVEEQTQAKVEDARGRAQVEAADLKKQAEDTEAALKLLQAQHAAASQFICFYVDLLKGTQTSHTLMLPTGQTSITVEIGQALDTDGFQKSVRATLSVQDSQESVSYALVDKRTPDLSVKQTAESLKKLGVILSCTKASASTPGALATQRNDKGAAPAGSEGPSSPTIPAENPNAAGSQ